MLTEPPFMSPCLSWLILLATYISWRPFLVMFLLNTLFGSSSSCHDISYSPSVLSRPSLPILSRNKTRLARPVTCMELLTLSLLGLPSLLILSPVMPLTDTDVSCHGCLCSSCLLPWLLLLALPPVMIPYARLDSLYSSCLCHGSHYKSCLLSWLPLFILTPVMAPIINPASCHGSLYSSCLLSWLPLFILTTVMASFIHPDSCHDSLYSSCLLSWLPLFILTTVIVSI